MKMGSHCWIARGVSNHEGPGLILRDALRAPQDED
jgi:hypothetical protein